MIHSETLHHKLTFFIKTHGNEFGLMTFLTVFLLSWTLFAGFLPLSTELDSTEEVVWSQSWQWGYYKHPPLPSALLHLLNIAFSGPSLAIIAFSSQLCSVVALVFVWLLGRQILTHKQAIVAVLITSLIAYHNTRALTFNHNTVSLPFTAAIWYFFYVALQTPRRWINWFWLGLVAGLAMLTKYSALIVLATLFIYLCWRRLWFAPYIIRGLLISCIVFLLIISPHVIWLSEHHWLPLTYIHHKLEISGSRFSILGRFWINQLIRLSFVLPVLLALWLLIKKNIIKTVRQIETSDHIDNKGFFLLTIQFVPLILAMMPTLLTGSMLNSNWVSAFFLPMGLLIVYYFFNRYDQSLLLNYTWGLTCLSQAIILGLFFLAALIYPSDFQGKAKRLNFPGQILADKVAEIWKKNQQQPLSIIVSNTWIGGNLLLHMRPEATVFVDANPSESPWVSAHDLNDCGGFVIVNQRLSNPLIYSELFNQASASGEFSLTWGRLPQGRTVHYLWAILVPKSQDRLCRFSLGSGKK